MKDKYKKENIELAIIDSKTWADVCRKLDIKANTGSQTYLKKKAVSYGISQPKHFMGQASNKGKSSPFRKDALEYCYNGSNQSSHKLKIALIRDGYKKAECESCGINEWAGVPVVLELDHIDNNHNNNELLNLKILCPNCHALKTRKNTKTNMR